jgi:hypothetical protein
MDDKERKMISFQYQRMNSKSSNPRRRKEESLGQSIFEQ